MACCLIIIWTNAGILLIGALRNKIQWNFIKNSYIVIHENALEKITCKMADFWVFVSKP